ncbi:hypothetical protein AC579_8672 [Pseudocercospora musae]|uniref:NADP-dependent oxidoreductase domain-containing protein n=1 Tax=Pseudocercospora musae TaxID=113226 RepID=A0A139I3Y7_9PEZI|nr:hypothetical protein AC579_8672 [Pseudocercospora musae]
MSGIKVVFDARRSWAKAGAPRRFTIDTKTRGGFSPNGGASKANIAGEVQTSKERLGSNVDILYIHAPDANTDLEETLSAINEVYKSGFFERFGLSNYQAEDVQKVYDHCKAKGYPLPQVYIKEIIQQLRGSKSSFFSPLCRANIANDEGVTKADLAYRWMRYSSPLKPEHGDAIIIGVSKVEQLKETISSINSGSLSENAVKRIDQVWETIKHEAPLDNFHL